MRRNSFITIPQAPPTGTEAPPPAEGCVRIDTDQDDLAWPNIPQPYVEGDWVRGATSLAVGKFEGYVYFENSPDQFDQFLLLSQVTGTFVDAEDLEQGDSSTGPWTSVGILADTPVDQVAADCDTGCFGNDCAPSTGGPEDKFTVPNQEPGGVGVKAGPRVPASILIWETDFPFGKWSDRYSYDTTIAGGSVSPVDVGPLTGQMTGAVAEISHWVDPGFGMGNLVVHVDGVTLGKDGTRFIHGEVLDHPIIAPVTLSNPMLEAGPFPLLGG